MTVRTGVRTGVRNGVRTEVRTEVRRRIPPNRRQAASDLAQSRFGFADINSPSGSES